MTTYNQMRKNRADWGRAILSAKKIIQERDPFENAAPIMTDIKEGRGCDCVTNCGDDTRVERGEVEPCNMSKAHDRSIILDDLGKIIIDQACEYREHQTESNKSILLNAVDRYSELKYRLS